MAKGHSQVEYCSGSQLKESSFQSNGLSWAAGISLRRGLRYTTQNAAYLPYSINAEKQLSGRVFCSRSLHNNQGMQPINKEFIRVVVLHVAVAADPWFNLANLPYPFRYHFGGSYPAHSSYGNLEPAKSRRLSISESSLVFTRTAQLLGRSCTFLACDVESSNAWICSTRAPCIKGLFDKLPQNPTSFRVVIDVLIHGG